MDDELDEVLEKAKELDAISYAIVHDQAKAIYSYLMEADNCNELWLELGGLRFKLDITHVDVLNEIYIMLDNLTKLGK